jgi:riboflavin kinase/FMN adenylyltransferase
VLTVQNTEHFRIESPTIVTIGTFDGVHLGHQKILNRLKQLKKETGLKTVVLTFEPHPRKVLFPEQKDLKLLTMIDEKLELLEKYGVDVTVVYPFSHSMAEMEADDYVKNILVKELNVKHLVIGYDHKFGKNRSGDISVLRSFEKKYNFTVEEISAKDIDHIAVSSSKIRKALEDGHLDQASLFLGHRFLLTAKVIKGKQLGRTIGFATANLQPGAEEKLIPKIGVYFVSVHIDGNDHYGMLNIGYNPTTDSDNKIKIEVHIFDFDADIYNKVLTLNFIKRLRDEKKFANLNELKAALEEDKQACFELMNDHA